MDAYRTEQEQLEQLKSWLRGYGPAFLVGSVLALLIGFAWQYWQRHVAEQHQTAALEYTVMINSLNDNQVTQVEQSAADLQNQFAKTPYAAWAAMARAKLAIANKQYDVAITQFQWVIDRSRDTSLIKLARLRLARIFIEQNQIEQALSLLAVTDPEQHDGLTQELRGDALIAQQDITGAQQAYETATHAYVQQGIPVPESLTLKQHNLHLLAQLSSKDHLL